MSIITGFGVILLAIGVLSLCLFPRQSHPEDWDIGPSVNPFEIAMFSTGILLLLPGLLLAYFSPLYSPVPNFKPRKVEMVIPNDAQMNAEIIQENTRIHLKNL